MQPSCDDPLRWYVNGCSYCVIFMTKRVVEDFQNTLLYTVNWFSVRFTVFSIEQQKRCAAL